MNIPRIAAVAVLVGAPVLGLAAPAVAHDGSHPFENCSAAYAAGYSNIPSGDEHYAKKLDRDGDGWGCDAQVEANDGKEGTGFYGEDEEASPAPSESAKGNENLAETGGDSATPYVAAVGAVLLVGGGVLAVRRKRQGV